VNFVHELATLLRPTSGSLAVLAGNARPSVARNKFADRRDWLRLRQRLELVPYDGLLRLGSAYGGYTVPVDLIRPDWVCYSAGLGEDVSFEVELARRCGCTVHAFDPTPRAIEHVRPLAEANRHLVFHPWGLWRTDSTQRFYAPRNESHASYSIVNLQGSDEFIRADCRSVPSVLRELGHDRLDLLKLDIEGAEYEVLASLVEGGIQPSVLCVDVHRRSTVGEMAAAVNELRGQLDLYPVHVYRTDVTLVAGRHLRFAEPS